jgi:hypothetical protein
MSRFLGRQALVIGAGMSGLAAAGALAKHFEQVIVLERDGLVDDPLHRGGTPQCRQLHGLLSGGLEALCQIFAGFDDDLAAAGAAPIREAAEIREELPGFDPFPRRDFGSILYGASRPLLEHTLRRRVRALRNVVIRDRCRILDLVSSADRSSIPALDTRESRGGGRRSRPTSSSTHRRAARSRSQRSTRWASRGRGRPASVSISATPRQPSRSPSSAPTGRLSSRFPAPRARAAVAFCCRSKEIAGWSASPKCIAPGRPSTSLNSWARQGGCGREPSMT